MNLICQSVVYNETYILHVSVFFDNPLYLFKKQCSLEISSKSYSLYQFKNIMYFSKCISY